MLVTFKIHTSHYVLPSGSCVTHKPLLPFVFLCVEHLQDFQVDSELQIYVIVQKMLPRIRLILLSYATPTVNLEDICAKIFQH